MKKGISPTLKRILILFFGVVMFFAGRITHYPGKLEVIRSLIDSYFVLDYDIEDIEDVAAKYMVSELKDPHSEYMTAEESEIFDEAMEGYYKGIGMTIGYNEETKEMYIEALQEGGPADAAGMKAWDVLLKVDELDITYESYDKVFYYIKGVSEDAPDDDTAMNFIVKRNNEELEFSVKRAELKYDNIDYENNDGILYIKLLEFTGDVAEEMENILKKQEEIKGIVLDLRDNPGGDLDILIDIADMYLPKGVILLTTEDASGEKTEYKIKDDKYYDVPLAVLTNGDSASASEVFASCIKENDRGVLIGETTYGKGLVQTIIPLGDGSALKLTIEKYYTSKGNYINGVGVEPDIVIEDYDKQKEAAFDYIDEKIK